MGRKRKPEALVAIEGRRSHLTKAQIAERQRAPGFTRAGVEPPAHLDGIALDTWIRLAGEFDRIGMLNETTLTALEGACVAYGRAVIADKTIAEEGQTFMTDNGPRAHPAVKISHESWMRYRAFAVEFGMTPASEGKILAPAAPKSDPIEDAMCG